MKRKLIIASGLFLMALSFHSCDQLKSCQTCQQNTYNSSGDILTEGSPVEYCDAELIKVKAIPPATVGGVTTKYVCK